MFKPFLDPIVCLIDLFRDSKVSRNDAVHNKGNMLTVPASVPVALTAALQREIGTVARHARGAPDRLHIDQ